MIKISPPNMHPRRIPTKITRESDFRAAVDPAVASEPLEVMIVDVMADCAIVMEEFDMLDALDMLDIFDRWIADIKDPPDVLYADFAMGTVELEAGESAVICGEYTMLAVLVTVTTCCDVCWLSPASPGSDAIFCTTELVSGTTIAEVLYSVVDCTFSVTCTFGVGESSMAAGVVADKGTGPGDDGD